MREPWVTDESGWIFQGWSPQPAGWGEPLGGGGIYCLEIREMEAWLKGPPQLLIPFGL